MSDERDRAEQAKAGAGAATQAYPASAPPGGPTQAYPSKGPAPATQAYGASVTGPAGSRHGLVAGQELEVGGRALRIVRLISGGTGEADVYLVDDGARGQLVLKLYREFSNLREEPNAEALARILELEHEAVLRLHDFGTGAKKFQGRFCYELSAYAAGGDLLDVPDLGAKYSPIFVEEQVVPQILAGISTLHGHRVFHCDLKPRNVFYLDAGQRDLVIGDYGSAKTWDQAARGVISHTSITKGSQLYMAPEQGQGMVSEKNDYYSFGMIVLHLLYPEKVPEGARWATFLERQLAEREIIDFDPRLKKFNALITGLTLRDWRRRWGRDEVQRWLQGDIAEVRLGQAAATIKLGKQTIATKEELVAYVEAGTDWYEVLVADRGGRQALLDWMDRTDGIGLQPRQAFDKLVRAAEPRGVDHVREVVLRFLEPQRPVVIDGTAYDLWGSTDPRATAADALRQLEAAYRVTEAHHLALWAFQLELALRGVAQWQAPERRPGAEAGLTLVDVYRKALTAREADRKAAAKALAAATTADAVNDIIAISQDWPDVLAAARAALPRVTQGELRCKLSLAKVPADIQSVIDDSSDWPDILAEARAKLSQMTAAAERGLAEARRRRLPYHLKALATFQRVKEYAEDRMLPDGNPHPFPSLLFESLRESQGPGMRVLAARVAEATFGAQLDNVPSLVELVAVAPREAGRIVAEAGDSELLGAAIVDLVEARARACSDATRSRGLERVRDKLLGDASWRERRDRRRSPQICSRDRSAASEALHGRAEAGPPAAGRWASTKSLTEIQYDFAFLRHVGSMSDEAQRHLSDHFEDEDVWREQYSVYEAQEFVKKRASELLDEELLTRLRVDLVECRRKHLRDGLDREVEDAGIRDPEALRLVAESWRATSQVDVERQQGRIEELTKRLPAQHEGTARAYIPMLDRYLATRGIRAWLFRHSDAKAAKMHLRGSYRDPKEFDAETVSERTDRARRLRDRLVATLAELDAVRRDVDRLSLALDPLHALWDSGIVAQTITLLIAEIVAHVASLASEAG